MTVARQGQLESLKRIEQLLIHLDAGNRAELALFGFIVGALYALHKAIMFGYTDRGEDNWAELRQIAEKVSHQDEITEIDWLSGFYFNSAIMRLAAIGERMYRYAGKQRDITPHIRKEVNRLKHDVLGVASGRTVTMRDALDAALSLSCILAQIVSSTRSEENSSPV
jgi:hypothetical protein